MKSSEKILVRMRLHSEWIHLTEDQEEELLDFVGYDYYASNSALEEVISDYNEYEKEEERDRFAKSQQFLTNVRYYLSIYEEAVVRIDNAPTSKEISDQFQKMRKDAYELCDKLLSMGIHAKIELENKGFDSGALIRMLGSFVTQTGKIVSENKKESRGRKGAVTRKAIINHLASEFDRYRISDSPTERAKIEFIESALGFAGIRKPKNLKRLFYRPGEKMVFFKQI